MIAGDHRSRAWVLVAVAVALIAVALAPARVAAQSAEADVFVARAVVAYEEKRYDDALEALREALQLDPDHVDALFYTALVRVAQDRLPEAAAALERARALAPSDEGVAFQLGFVYFSLGRYEQAEPLLEQAFARRPNLEGLGYYVGYLRYRRKDYQGALAAFRGGTAADPTLQQLSRFYSGLALAIMGLPEAAAAEIDEARRLQPASPLTGPAERLRDAVASLREREARFRVEVRLGVFYDDNVVVNPDPSQDPIARLLRQREQTSFGELGGIRLDYTFFRQGPLDATVTYSLFGTHNNQVDDFDVLSQLAGLSSSYRGTLGSLPYQAGGQYTYEFLTLDNKEFVQRHTLTAYASLVENANNLTTVQVRWQHKEFSNDTNIPRQDKADGYNYLVGVTHLFRFMADRLILRLGYQFDVEDTLGPDHRGEHLAYVGHRGIAGISYTLPWYGIRLKYDFDVHVRDYQFGNRVLSGGSPSRERFDTEYTHVPGVVVPLPWKLRVADRDTTFTFALDYQATRTTSNFDVFDFSRNVVSAVVIWQY